MADKIPFQSKIESIELVNFKGTKKIDLSGQAVLLDFYESIFSSLQKAILVISDSISLFNHFPLIGEELVIITFKMNNNLSSYAYVIDAIDDITPSDRAREVSYKLRLSSITALPNVMARVQHAYHGTTSNIIKEIFNRYITTPLIRMDGRGIKYALQQSISNFIKIKNSNVEDSLGSDEGTIIVPNMRPLQAIEWLSREATPKETKKSYDYLFWQANDGFHFETAQRLCRKSSKRTLIYYSDNAILSKLSQTEKNNAIVNITINNRISTLNKIASGYFQNSLFEINLAQLKYKTHDSTLDDYKQTVENRLKVNKTNTNTYIESVKTSGGIDFKNRVKYVFNNRQDNDKVTPLHNREEVWGNMVRSSVAFSQVDLHITIMGDATLSAGDIITIELPKMEGFNKSSGNSEDKFITGRYIITEIKNAFLTSGGVHSTVLRINKDTYFTDPDNAKFEYGNSSDYNVKVNSITGGLSNV